MNIRYLLSFHTFLSVFDTHVLSLLSFIYTKHILQVIHPLCCLFFRIEYSQVIWQVYITQASSLKISFQFGYVFVKLFSHQDGWVWGAWGPLGLGVGLYRLIQLARGHFRFVDRHSTVCSGLVFAIGYSGKRWPWEDAHQWGCTCCFEPYASWSQLFALFGWVQLCGQAQHPDPTGALDVGPQLTWGLGSALGLLSSPLWSAADVGIAVRCSGVLSPLCTCCSNPGLIPRSVSRGSIILL